jgi:glycosyltransferase involved in cell wall biosynthesis
MDLMSQRVLLVHRYFWPDVPPYAQMLRFIGARLAADGHAVDVFCGPSTYNDAYAGPGRPGRDALAGIRVHRMRLPGDDKARPVLRATSLVVFALRLVVFALRHRRRYDLLTVTTIPPVIMGVAARVIKRLTGIPFVYHCMDLYPEVAEVAGLSRNRLLLRLARRLDTTTCRRAAAVVVLSQDMRATLLARGLADANIIVCNNFDLLDEADDAPADVLPIDPDRYRVTFAGNLGRFQGLEDVVDAAGALCAEHPDLDLVFLGSGVLADPLRERAGALLGRQVHFLGQQPVAAAALALAHSQLALVSLRPGMYRVAYPSKTMTCLAAGCRLLAVVEDESELAALVRDEDLGAVCPPGDVVALKHAISAELERGPMTDAERERLRAVAAKHFDRAEKLDEWSGLLLAAVDA